MTMTREERGKNNIIIIGKGGDDNRETDRRIGVVVGQNQQTSRAEAAVFFQNDSGGLICWQCHAFRAQHGCPQPNATAYWRL